MKKLLLAAGGLVAAASAAIAGGLSPAMIEPAIIPVQEKASSFGWLIPLLIIGLLVALATQDQQTSN